MRIGIFSDRYLPLTDGVTFSIELYRIEMEKLGHEVFIFAPKPSLRYKERAKNVFRFPAIKGLFFEDYLTTLFFPPAVVRQVDKLNLDIIHFHTPGQVGLFGAYYAIHRKLPLITTYHTDMYEYVKHYPAVLPGTLALTMLSPVIFGGGLLDYKASMSTIRPERSIDAWNQKIVVQGLTMLHNRCDLVIVPSKKIEKQLKSWKTKSPIIVLPTGVDALPATDSAIRAAKRKYHIQSKDKVILVVCRMGTEKNIDMLLDAFEYVARDDPQAKLMLVGDGDDRKSFEDHAGKSAYSNRIIFTGRIDRSKLGPIYRLATVFAFPSTADTQGMATNEAATAGLPCVVTDSGVTEVVKNGKSGYFAKNDPRDMASKLLLILGDPKKQSAFGKRSRELASALTPSSQTTKLLRLYEEVIERHENAKDRMAN